MSDDKTNETDTIPYFKKIEPGEDGEISDELQAAFERFDEAQKKVISDNERIVLMVLSQAPLVLAFMYFSLRFMGGDSWDFDYDWYWNALTYTALAELVLFALSTGLYLKTAVSTNKDRHICAVGDTHNEGRSALLVQARRHIWWYNDRVESLNALVRAVNQGLEDRPEAIPVIEEAQKDRAEILGYLTETDWAVKEYGPLGDCGYAGMIQFKARLDQTISSKTCGFRSCYYAVENRSNRNRFAIVKPKSATRGQGDEILPKRPASAEPAKLVREQPQEEPDNVVKLRAVKQSTRGSQ